MTSGLAMLFNPMCSYITCRQGSDSCHHHHDYFFVCDHYMSTLYVCHLLSFRLVLVSMSVTVRDWHAIQYFTLHSMPSGQMSCNLTLELGAWHNISNSERLNTLCCLACHILTDVMWFDTRARSAFSLSCQRPVFCSGEHFTLANGGTSDLSDMMGGGGVLHLSPTNVSHYSKCLAACSCNLRESIHVQCIMCHLVGIKLVLPQSNCLLPLSLQWTVSAMGGHGRQTVLSHKYLGERSFGGTDLLDGCTFYRLSQST